VTYTSLWQKINETDALIASFEDEAIARVEWALNAAFRGLDKELRRKWIEGESKDLAGKDRAVLMLAEIKDYLSLLPEGGSGVEDLYKALIADAAAAGIDFGTAAIDSVAGSSPGFVAAKTVKPNIKAVAYQAQDAAKRLYRHDADFQLRASKIIEQGLVQGSGVGRVASALRREMGVMAAKAETIARTETMSAMDSAARDTYRRNGIEYVQRIGTQDKLICPFCAARAGNVYEIDKAPSSLHPRDRCYNAPWRKQWADMGLVDEAWLQKHKADIVARLAEQGKKPDYGLAPFERLNGMLVPPDVIWSVGNRSNSGLGDPPNLKASNTGYTNKFISKGKEITKSLEKQFKTANVAIQLAESRFALASAAFDAKFDELGDMSATYKSAEGIEYNAANIRLITLKAEKSDLLIGTMFKIRQDLIKANPSNPQVAKLQISKKATTEMAEADIRSNIDEFSRITGGRGISTLKQIVLDDDRAWADDETGELNIGRRGDDVAGIRRMLFHELGHFLEFENPGIAKAAKEWVESRATGKLSTLKDIDPGYGDDETYYPDKFIDPYVGRLYQDGSTEVVSMGIENFADPLKMAELYKKDPEHFNFIMGILSNG
jgi:SPP1 gp7 family putative phage head morphogenesis protein